MNYKKLGNTNLDVSTICLGTMTWGEQNTQKEGFEQMDYAIDQGVNFWDTAEIYSIPMREETYGETERIIGNWFEKTNKRNKIVLATKVCGNTCKKNSTIITDNFLLNNDPRCSKNRGVPEGGRVAPYCRRLAPHLKIEDSSLSLSLS